MRLTRLLVALVALAGCSIKELTIETTAGLLSQGSQSMADETDFELARAAIPGQLKTVDGLLVSAPENRTLLELAARGELEFSFGFLEDDLEKLADKGGPERRLASARASALYDRAFGHALRYLATFDPHIRDALTRSDAAFADAVKGLPKESVAGLTYGGMALASAINLDRADPARVADVPAARALLERAYALDPTFYFGGAAMSLGIMSAQTGHKDDARRYLHEAVDASGGRYLLTRLMMARTLLEGGERRAALHAVLEAPADALPHARLANEIAKRRALRDQRTLTVFRAAPRFFAVRPPQHSETTAVPCWQGACSGAPSRCAESTFVSPWPGLPPARAAAPLMTEPAPPLTRPPSRATRPARRSRPISRTC